MSTSRAFSKGLPSPDAGTRDWSLAQMAGRFVEISGDRASANLTVAVGLVREAQRRGDWACWVTLRHSTFFPPDVAASGVSLAHLAVIRVETLREATRATLELTRSGGFDLVVLDIGPEAIAAKLAPRAQAATKARTKAGTEKSPGRHLVRRRFRERFSTPLLTKLTGLARKHQTAVVVLTEKNDRASSVCSLVSLRAETRRSKDDPEHIEVSVLKDKKRGPGYRHSEVCRAPDGLR